MRWDCQGGYTYICFMRLELDELQRPHQVNVLLGWRNRNHVPLQNQVAHICQQDLQKIPETQKKKSTDKHTFLTPKSNIYVCMSFYLYL